MIIEKCMSRTSKDDQDIEIKTQNNITQQIKTKWNKTPKLYVNEDIALFMKS